MRIVLPEHKVYVYIAGPICNGGAINDPEVIKSNCFRAISVADHLMVRGFIPFVPHLNCGWHDLYPHSHEEWLAWDYAWLKKCNAVLRIGGESKGADQEVTYALNLQTKWGKGLPVFYAEDDLIRWYQESIQWIKDLSPSEESK